MVLGVWCPNSQVGGFSQLYLYHPWVETSTASSLGFLTFPTSRVITGLNKTKQNYLRCRLKQLAGLVIKMKILEIGRQACVCAIHNLHYFRCWWLSLTIHFPCCTPPHPNIISQDHSEAGISWPPHIFQKCFLSRNENLGLKVSHQARLSDHFCSWKVFLCFQPSLQAGRGLASFSGHWDVNGYWWPGSSLENALISQWRGHLEPVPPPSFLLPAFGPGTAPDEHQRPEPTGRLWWKGG